MLGYSDSNRTAASSLGMGAHKADQTGRRVERTALRLRLFTPAAARLSRRRAESRRDPGQPVARWQRGRVSITEQGEIISSKYPMPKSPCISRRSPPQRWKQAAAAADDAAADYLGTMEELSSLAYAAYRALVYETTASSTTSGVDRHQRDCDADIAAGQPPQSTRRIEDLRAIPWVSAGRSAG